MGRLGPARAGAVLAPACVAAALVRAVAAAAGTMPASSRHSRTRSSRTAGFTLAVTTGVMEASHANALAAWPSSHAVPSPPTTDAAARVLRRDGKAAGLRVSRSMSRTMTTATAPASIAAISQAGSAVKTPGSARRTSGTLTDWNAFEKACVCHGVRLSAYRRYRWSNGPGNLDRGRMCSGCISRTRSLLRSDERAAQRCRKVT